MAKLDWQGIKEDLQTSIKNERIWGMGGSLHSGENIERYEHLINLIDNEQYDDFMEEEDMEYYYDNFSIE